MSEIRAGIPVETWTVPEARLTIEYCPQTMEEIRQYALTGLKRLSRGGVEVGGVLFGTRGDNIVRITAWRRIECEHSTGAAFHLSQSDRTALGEFLNIAKSDPELQGLHALGFFVSHIRGGIALTEADLKTYNHYFPWSWQVALVLQPSKESWATAGFFFRDLEGNVRADASYREFAIGAGAPAELPPPAVVSMAPAPVRAPLPKRSPRPPVPRARGLGDRRLWIWAVPVLLAVIVAAMLVERPARTGTPSLALRVVDSGGELHLEWDRNSEAIRDAVRGTLEIKDGSSTVQLPLEPERLREGQFNYTRKSGDLEARMTVFPVNGSPVQEFARFVGPPGGGNGEDPAQVRRERDSLVNEVDRLREVLRKETNRNRELEDAVRILENRVQVEQLHRPGANPPANK